MKRKVVRQDLDGDTNEFNILVDGEIQFVCEREHVVIKGEARRGYWVLKMLTSMGPLIVERNQYSNDIMERVDIHVNERPMYGERFRIQCVSRPYCNENLKDWLEDATTLFGGEWTGYYDDHNGWAILEKI